MSAAALAIASAALGAPARAEDYALDELPPLAHAAIDQGLEFLVAQQDLSGAFGRQYKLATTSLAGLALLSTGDHYGRGRYGEPIQRAVRFVLSDDVVQRRFGGDVLLADREYHQGRMHSHGYALLFLAQVYGQTDRDRELADIIRGAVQLTEKAQTHRGGYGYALRGEPGHDEDEASVTITQIQALRAARDAGFRVDPGVIDRAVEYVKRSMGPDGSVCYSITTAPERRTYELTAAAVSTLNAAGVYYSEELSRGLAFMRRRLRAARSADLACEQFYFYGNLYAVQAMFQAGGADWQAWFPSARQSLLERQKNGGWQSEQYGDAYATACALLILQVPKRMLPSLQR